MDNAVASSSVQAPPPQQQADFDIWEFVNCSRCHLTFSPDGLSGPTVPFWLTECGHIVCNTHLNSDQSCPTCDAKPIELMPLQKDLPSPMSDWFCALPYQLDSVAQAAKFQQGVLASTVRYYRNKCGQYRHLCERMRTDLKAYKSEVESLRQENESYRAIHGTQAPGSSLNANGKRRMVDYRQATSSPRSIHTPLGPTRITLPPNQEPPPSLPKNPGSDGSGSFTLPRSQQQARPGERPGSRGFNQQYAYIPPQTPQLQPQQVLSHQQQAPIRRAMEQMQTANDRQLMPPPPTPAHVRQQAQQAQSMNQDHRPRMTMAQPRASNPGNLSSTNGAHVPHPSTYNVDSNYRQTPVQAPQNFSTRNVHQNQDQNHPIMPPMSAGNQQHVVSQTPRRFKPSNAVNANAPPGSIAGNAGNAGNGRSNAQRFVPPMPILNQRFVPPSAATGPSGMAMSTGSSGSSAGHQKKFTPALVSASVPSTPSLQRQQSLQAQLEPQPHAQRMAFTPRKNRFS